MTEQERAEWQERLRAAVAKTLQRRAERRRIRAQLDQARDQGLQHRHQTKLDRKD